MSCLKMLLILCALLTLYSCDSMKKKHKHKHHHYDYDLYWHGFHYLTFLFFKFKVIFVLGSIFTIGLFAGKLFAIFKFAEYMKKSQHINHHDYSHDDNHEKIIYLNSHDGKSHDYFPAGGSYPPGYAVDQPPSNVQISGTGGNIGVPSQSTFGQAYGPPNGYGRSSNIKENSIYDTFILVSRMIKKLNVTEMAFNSMNLKTDDCKRKFVCETDFNVNQSSILRAAYEVFSDDGYLQYKTKKKITSYDECATLYPNCVEAT